MANAPRSHQSPSPHVAPLKRVATDIGIPYTTLRDRSHEFGVYRIGRALYVDSRDVVRWLDSCRESA